MTDLTLPPLLPSLTAALLAPQPQRSLPALRSMAGILSPKSDHTASSINPATAAAADLSVPSALHRTPPTEAVRTRMIVFVSLPLMNTVHSWTYL